MRPLEPEERLALLGAFESFGVSLDEVLRDHGAEVWIDGSRPPRVYLVPTILARRVPQGDLQPKSIGLPLGDLDGERFRPGLEGAYEIGLRCRRRRVVLRPKGAQLFLYGRDVLGEGIAEADRSMVPGTVAIILDQNGESLGLARVLQKLPGKGRALEPIVDRGWYLREGD